MCEISNRLYDMPKKHGLSVDWIADQIGCNPSSLYRQLNPHDHHPFPLKKLIPFMNACNRDYSLLDLIESRVGRVAIDMPGKKETVNMKTASKIAEQQGKALATLIDALADNKLDEDEKRALRHEYFKLAQLIHSALQELNK